VLDLIAKGVGQRAIAVQFGVAKSTTGNMLGPKRGKMYRWKTFQGKIKCSFLF
jgi:hypothetical protein